MLLLRRKLVFTAGESPGSTALKKTPKWIENEFKNGSEINLKINPKRIPKRIVKTRLVHPPARVLYMYNTCTGGGYTRDKVVYNAGNIPKNIEKTYQNG